MCIEDWRIGRLIRSQITTVSATSGIVLSVPPSMQRVAVTLAMNLAPATQAGSQTITIGGVLFGQLHSSNSPLHLTAMEYGDLVNKSISLTCGVTAATLSITEYFLPESVLSELPEANARAY